MRAPRHGSLFAALLVVSLASQSGCGDTGDGLDEMEPGTDEVFQPATVPSGFSDTQVVTGLSAATAMAFAPDGRLFVCEQGGRLRVIKNGSLLSTPFLTVSVSSSGERGLLGVAFDPNFASNQFVYVYYTATTPAIHNRLSRFTANGDVAVAGSEVILLELDNLSSATNHNGGAIHFGPDGKLYVAVGDNANGNNAQTLSNLLGKMLRLNADGTIPTDNPFFAQATGKNRAIWARGLRNPFTFTFQPGTGKMYINDVGQNAWEEVNQGAAGANYGWPATEGPTSNPAYVSPVHAYGHGSGDGVGCAITGGAFYNPPTATFPAQYVGNYFFADYCSGWIRRLDSTTGAVIGTFASNIASPVDLQVGPDGALYYLARGSNAVFKISFNQGTAPSITSHPASRTVAVGQSASFSVAATGTAPLAYQWQRNGANLAGANGTSYTLASATAADSGAAFRVVVSNGFGSVTSNAATLTVTSNAAPTASITAPAAGATYAGGQTITYAGSASDAEDGTLPASAYTWSVVFHHDTHTHPFIPETGGATGGSFVIPTSGETATNVWYRIHLTVRDSAGLTTTVTRDVLPRVANLTLATSPAGLSLTLDGQPVASGSTTASVVGITRTLGAPSPQTAGGTSYVFESWSDGGAASHAISTPATNTTYTATFRAEPPPTGTVGLRGEYHDNADFTGTRVVRVDPTVNFDWGSGAPIAGIGANTFSVRWTGTVRPPTSGSYTFYTTSDDGVRLYVNDQRIIDNWTDHAATENSGTITLVAGQRATIRMEMYENGGLAVARLSWSGPSVAKQIIPSDRLAPLTLAIGAVSNGKAYRVATAAAGTLLFIDRTYTITTIPAQLEGGLMVQAANDDKNVTANPHITAQLGGPATLYVAYDVRGTTMPAWLTDGSWTLTSLQMTTSDGIGTLARRIYSRNVDGGTVTFGGNAQPPAAGAGTTYTVVAVPR
jgi:glucose/arabinose dehydrogenase